MMLYSGSIWGCPFSIPDRDSGGGVTDLAQISQVMRKPVFGFPTRSDISRAVQQHKTARGLESREIALYTHVTTAKTKALINCAVNEQLICDFVFAYENSSFSTFPVCRRQKKI